MKKLVSTTSVTIAQNILLLSIIEASLTVFGVRRTWQVLASFSGFPDRPNEPVLVARKQLKYLKRSRQLSPIKGKCLSRSLVLWWQLHRRGVSTTLLIGVKQKEWLHAHAWLQIENHILNAGKLVHNRYTTLAAFNHPKEMP